MKKFLIACLLLSGCTQSTLHGPCVGVVDAKDPNLTYTLSYWNVAMGFIFSGTIIVPAIVVLKDLECPTGAKK